jgi:hypothetical protein
MQLSKYATALGLVAFFFVPTAALADESLPVPTLPTVPALDTPGPLTLPTLPAFTLTLPQLVVPAMPVLVAPSLPALVLPTIPTNTKVGTKKASTTSNKNATSPGIVTGVLSAPDALLAQLHAADALPELVIPQLATLGTNPYRKIPFGKIAFAGIPLVLIAGYRLRRKQVKTQTV